MKYSKSDYESVITAFDRTIKGAQDSRESILFDCIDIPTVRTPLALHGCPKYCPLYGDGSMNECTVAHDAAYWQFAKEKFIIENEPQD